MDKKGRDYNVSSLFLYKLSYTFSAIKTNWASERCIDLGKRYGRMDRE